MSSVESAAVEQPKPSRVWIWVLGFLALSLIGHGIGKQEETMSNFGFGVGFWLIPIALGTLVFVAIFKASREYRWRVFAVLYGCALVGHYIGGHFQRNDEAKAMAGMRESLVSMLEQVNAGDPNAVPRPIDLQPATSSATGDLGVTEILTKQMLNDAAATHNEYLKALENAGWMGILDSARLAKDPSMEDSLAIVERTEAIVKEYRAKGFAIIDSMPQRVAQAPFRSETARRQVAKGMEAGLTRARLNNTINWDYEEQIMEEYRGIIELLARRRGKYAFQPDGTVVFESVEDVETYNAHMSRADEIIRRQAEAMQKQQADALKKLDAASR